jgi:hypothetical protein
MLQRNTPDPTVLANITKTTRTSNNKQYFAFFCIVDRAAMRHGIRLHGVGARLM